MNQQDIYYTRFNFWAHSDKINKSIGIKQFQSKKWHTSENLHVELLLFGNLHFKVLKAIPHPQPGSEV